MTRKISILLFVVLVVTSTFAERWVQVVADSFRSHMTFAEEWRTENADRVKSEAGHLVFFGPAAVRRVCDTPKTCRISAAFVVKEGKAGVRCGGRQAVANAGESKTVILQCDHGDFSGKPLELFAEGEATVDDFLVEVPVDESVSPNMMVNSGFEHNEDGSAPFFQYQGRFNWDRCPGEEYETRYLKRFQVVDDERHGGRYSLRMWLNKSCRDIRLTEYHRSTGGPLVARPRDDGGVKVFSAWLKSSVPDVVVELVFGAKKKVTLTTDWRRYELSTTNKAVFCEIIAPGEYPEEAMVWIDDLQKEEVRLPPGLNYDPAASYAGEYRPSDSDERLFSPPKEIVPPPPVAVKRLPNGVKPTADFATWSRFASPVGPFLVRAYKVPNKETEACIACDADNLYIGWRNSDEEPSGVTKERKNSAEHDTKGIYCGDSVELLFRMDGAKPFYHFMGAPNGELYDKYDDDENWNGEWSVAAREWTDGVDYLVTIPFATLAKQGFAGRFFANVCRNDSHDWKQRESAATTRAEGWREVEGWGAFDLPSEIAEKWIAVARAGTKAVADEVRRPEVMSRLDYYMDEPVAHFRIWDENGALHTAELDVSRLPAGTNSVEITSDGRVYSGTLVKLPYRDNAIQVNRFARCVQRHGKKLLFSGPCLIPRWLVRDKGGPLAQVEMCRKAGFRYIHFIAGWGQRKDLDMALQLLDWGAASGVDFLCWTGLSWDNENRKNKDDIDTEEYFRLVDRPNVLSQMVLDEPELGKTSEWSRDFLRRSKRCFPYTPVQMNNTIFGIPNRFAGLETDILMLDAYMTADLRGKPNGLFPVVEQMREADRGKPCWIFVVSDNTSLHYKTPSYGEQVAQSWGCICWGVTGLSWYVGIPSVEATWRAMVDVNREVQSLADEILSEESCEPARTPLDRRDLAILTRRTGDTWHVFTCNVTDTPCEKLAITLGGDAPREGTVEVLFENRTLPLRNGAFVDSYRPYERHIYRISSK